MVHWHGWQILLIDNSCKQKAQLRLVKIEIARCNLAGGEKSFVGVVWPQFDHKRNETSWHPMKQNDIIYLKFNDTESRQYRIVHCVFERSTMGFKRPWVRFSPLGPNKNNPNLFPIGDGFGLFVFFGKLAFAQQQKPQWGFWATERSCVSKMEGPPPRQVTAGLPRCSNRQERPGRMPVPDGRWLHRDKGKCLWAFSFCSNARSFGHR